LFDDEVRMAREELLSDPLYRPAAMLDALAKVTLEWRADDDPEVELSLSVLACVQQSYDEEDLIHFASLIDATMRTRGAEFKHILAMHEGSREDYELLFRPEGLAIFERLLARPHQLRADWVNSGLPNEWLDSITKAVGLGQE